MMRALLVFPAVCTLIFFTPAVAQVDQLTVRQIDNGGMGDLAGTVTNDLSIDFTDELRGQQILLELSEGTIYQHLEGSNLPPIASLIPEFPNLAFDTFLTMGGIDSDSSLGVIEVGRIFNLGLDPNRPSFGPNYIDAAWASATGVVILDQSDFRIARITLSNDAQGTWQYFGSVADSWRTFGAGTVSGGVMIVAEPTSPLLVGAAILGLLMLCRAGNRPELPSFGPAQVRIATNSV